MIITAETRPVRASPRVSLVTPSPPMGGDRESDDCRENNNDLELARSIGSSPLDAELIGLERTESSKTLHGDACASSDTPLAVERGLVKDALVLRDRDSNTDMRSHDGDAQMVAGL